MVPSRQCHGINYKNAMYFFKNKHDLHIQHFRKVACRGSVILPCRTVDLTLPNQILSFKPFEIDLHGATNLKYWAQRRSTLYRCIVIRRPSSLHLYLSLMTYYDCEPCSFHRSQTLIIFIAHMCISFRLWPHICSYGHIFCPVTTRSQRCDRMGYVTLLHMKHFWASASMGEVAYRNL